MDISSLRRDYKLQSLDLADVSTNPIEQFKQWFDAAVHSEVPEPNAMMLATCTPEGKPSARIVLLKGFDEAGFVFYTNYLSRKGHEMAANPNVALVFCWLELERSVRIEGRGSMISTTDSEAYFHSRPRLSQIGALASMQSRVIADRSALEREFAALEAKYEGQDIPKPEHWGGYAVKPEVVEFWQGRRSRLHDRLQYSRSENGDWKIERLSP